MPDQRSVSRSLVGTNSSNTSLGLKASRESAAATAAGKLFHCLIVHGNKLCWMKVLVSDERIKELE